MALLAGAEWCLAQLLRHQTVAASRAVRIPDTSLRTLANRAGAPLSGHITTMCCLVEVAMSVRCWYLGVLVLGLCSLATHTFAQANSEVAPKHIRVTLLGTASGPRAFVDKAGISTLVEAGGERFLFDAGRGSMQRLVQAGFPMNAVTKLFLTHLHSDHVIGVPDLMLSPWSAAPERKVPLEIWGPVGTRDMMRHLEEAFAFDIHMRRDVDESFSPEGIKTLAHDIRPGKVYEKNGVTVTAFLVSHGLVKPSYGYRVDYAGRSVALSGDTSPNDNLIAVCKAVDVLIHEAIDVEVLRRLVPDKSRMDAIVARHTTPEQAASIFSKVSPRLAVFSHSPGTPAIVEQTRRSYAGRVEMGEDLMVVDIGAEVLVKPAAAGVPSR
jgi:ribonuclease Z